MKVLIVSDTHGREDNLEKVLEKESPIDAMVHLGDVEGSEDYIRILTDAPVYMVAGNNDFYTDLPGQAVIDLDGFLAGLGGAFVTLATINQFRPSRAYI